MTTRSNKILKPNQLMLKPRHADNGRSSKRVAQLLASHPCRCEKSGCFQKVEGCELPLGAFLNLFWSLEKPAQDAYVSASDGSIRACCAKPHTVFD